MSLKNEILRAIQEITGGDSGREFTVGEVVAKMEQLGTTYKRPSIRVHLASKMSAPEDAAADGGRHDVQRLGKGRYQLLAK